MVEAALSVYGGEQPADPFLAVRAPFRMVSRRVHIYWSLGGAFLASQAVKASSAKSVVPWGANPILPGVKPGFFNSCHPFAPVTPARERSFAHAIWGSEACPQREPVGLCIEAPSFDLACQYGLTSSIGRLPFFGASPLAPNRKSDEVE